MKDARRGAGLSEEELKRLMRDRFERPMAKRFYERARATGEAPPFGVALDGRRLRTPMKAPLETPTRALAEAVAEEWARQKERINPFDMPLTRLCNAAIDRARGRGAEVVAAICEYGAHDLLCYRAGEPEELVRRQTQAWDGPLRWAEEQIGARFVLAQGIMPVEQPRETMEALRRRYLVFGDFQLAALNNMAALSASAILPLCVAAGRLSAEEAWRASTVEEAWNVSQWGEDAEAAARLEQRRKEFLSAGRLLELLRAE